MGDMGVIGIIKKHPIPLASSIPLSIYITDEEGKYQVFDHKILYRYSAPLPITRRFQMNIGERGYSPNFFCLTYTEGKPKLSDTSMIILAKEPEP